MGILVTGGSGKLGRKLKPIISAHFPSHKELDIVIEEDVKKYVEENEIDIIIHCAALTNIRLCESDREQAFNVNVNGTRNLLKPFNSLGGYFIYVSTACVFSGDDTDHFYSEHDIPYPKNFYGLTKLIGETVVSSYYNSLIIRTNFIERGEWPYSHAFTDRFANYLYTDQVAQKIKELLYRKTIGTIHIHGNKRMSMYEFAKIHDSNINPITLEDYDGPPLTINMCLKSEREKP